jgi:hypothetical protein
MLGKGIAQANMAGSLPQRKKPVWNFIFAAH